MPTILSTYNLPYKYATYSWNLQTNVGVYYYTVVAPWVSWTTDDDFIMLFGSKSVEIKIHYARHGKITTIIIFIDPYDDGLPYEINDFG